MKRTSRTRVLFIAEAVTLAHVARAYTLASLLEPSRFDVQLAWDPRYNHLLGPLAFPFQPIRSLPTALFLERLSRGLPMHDDATLRGYVEEDSSILRQAKPDVVIGDFRLSLPVSAAVAGVPLVTVTNAYWSPYGHQSFLFPEYDYPLSTIVGDRAARILFRLFKRIGFAAHTRPLNTLLREHGLPQVGPDIRRMYAAGDYTAYPDIPHLVPLDNLPATHAYIGPVIWSPHGALPAWWDDVPTDRPVIYVTLGSSGEGAVLPLVLSALSDLPVSVIAATADRARVGATPANARVAAFLPGQESAARASLVICNGGSPTTYQALTVGVPVLAIPSNNMDQHLNMDAVRRAGAGQVLRSSGLTARDIRAGVSEMLATDRYRRRAQAIASAHTAWRAGERFPELMEMVMRGEKQTGSPSTPGLSSQEN